MDEFTINEDKVFAFLSYLSLLCIIPLALKKENPFVLHHAKHGLILFVGEVSVFILHILLGQWILKLGIIMCGIVSLLGIITVLKGEHLRLPYISDIAEKITL